jgi:hypothetical protein
MIKKPFTVILIISASLFISAQEIQHEAVAVNVEVPVRVFKGTNSSITSPSMILKYTRMGSCRH